jgi:hypothetical protein
MQSLVFSAIHIFWMSGCLSHNVFFILPSKGFTMKGFLLTGVFACLFFSVFGQSVGIGTTNPNPNAILDLGPAGKPLIIPRLTGPEMNGVNANALGMMLYNTTEHQMYAYMRYRTSFVIGQSNNRWQPIATGPKMIAWGVVDSFGLVKTGSGNFTISWNATDSWYELTVTSHPYYRDSMLLMINAVGNGSWDQTISTGEIISGSQRWASIKFVDVSRQVAGWGSSAVRRRSWFHFTLYDLRKDPYNILNR